nr:DNA replication/repair protein RecF [uncultured Halomonas sp.]
MSLDRLTFQGLRNLQTADIRPSAGVNLIIGDNGSGKTSLLEGIHILGLGRSFRTQQLKHAIQHDVNALSLHGRLKGDPPLPIGIRRERSATEPTIRMAGESVTRIAQLAEALPLQLINPDAFRLLEGSPVFRREFFDWGVFHVKHEFFDIWRRVRRALKHRNALLRHGKIDRQNLAVWDRELANYGVQLDALRSDYMKNFSPIFEETLKELLPLYGADLTLRYFKGWDHKRSYSEVLRDSHESDRQMGFTQQGPQRADLRIRIGRRPAKEVLSRGQQKLVVSALKLAQGRLLENITGRRCIYLIDDLPAELDEHHRHAFCNWLERMQCQVFITSVEPESLLGFWQATTPLSMFHVKHGQLTDQE